MSKKYKIINLKEVLQFLEGKEENNKPFLFINTKGSLETFFKYKANMKEIYKMKDEYELNPDKRASIQDEINSSLEYSMKIGHWLVFHLGDKSDFNLIEFLKHFPFYDKDMFKPDYIKNKDYCLKTKIIRQENDKDFEGNVGFFEILEKFKFCFLSTIQEDKIDDLLKINKEIDFDVIIVRG